uniref:Uncharacterized protein n=1 Tax=Arundo donax TaxID=35708 RepID=A0A0A8YF26_ARUDO
MIMKKGNKTFYRLFCLIRPN